MVLERMSLLSQFGMGALNLSSPADAACRRNPYALSAARKGDLHSLP